MLRSLPFAVACVVTVSSSAFAAGQTPQKWQGHTELEGKWGTERSLGEMGVFIPVWQDEDTLLSADIRQRIDDANSQEGNYGLSLRQLLSEQDVILGGYAFFDRRRTPNANVFNQATLGAEALWTDYEARLNVYIPESTEEALSAGTSSASVVGSSIQVQNFSGTTERALPGFDVELGAKFDLSEEWKLWLYGGGFYFDHSGYDTVAGPRARLEISRGNLPMFGAGSRLTLGLEAQHDNVRGDQAFAIARIRVPFAAFGGQGQADDLSALEQRMTGRIYRDVDIVSGESAPQLVSTETGMVTLGDGTQVSDITQVDADVAGGLASALSMEGANSLVVVDGSAGTFNVTTATLQSGQTLIGGGATLTATTASGKSASVTMPGSKPTINGTSAVSETIVLADDTTLQHVNVTGGIIGVFGGAFDNMLVEDVVVSNTTQHGINTGSGGNMTVRNTEITNAGTYGIVLSNGTLVADNVTIRNSGTYSIDAQNQSHITLRNSTVEHNNNSQLMRLFGSAPNSLHMESTHIQITSTGSIFLFGNAAISGNGNTVDGTFGGWVDSNGGNSGSLAFDDVNGGGATTLTFP